MATLSWILRWNGPCINSLFLFLSWCPLIHTNLTCHFILSRMSHIRHHKSYSGTKVSDIFSGSGLLLALCTINHPIWCTNWWTKLIHHTTKRMLWVATYLAINLASKNNNTLGARLVCQSVGGLKTSTSLIQTPLNPVPRQDYFVDLRFQYTNRLNHFFQLLSYNANWDNILSSSSAALCCKCLLRWIFLSKSFLTFWICALR